jgi:hypothetical protein
MTRPDVAETVIQLSRFKKAPCQHHLSVAKQALRYLFSTRTEILTYSSSASSQQPFLTGYSDASWGSDSTTRRSVTGYVFIAGSAAVSWRSATQRIVGDSSMASEYYSLSDAANHGAYLIRLLNEIGVKQPSVTIYCDNLSSIDIARDPINTSKSRYIDIRAHKIRELVNAEIINVQYREGVDLIADQLTKPLSAPATARYRNIMLGRNLPSQQLQQHQQHKNQQHQQANNQQHRHGRQQHGQRKSARKKDKQN